MIARSSTLLASGPTEFAKPSFIIYSSPITGGIPTTPMLDILSGVGMKELIPQKDAGTLRDPPASVPIP